MDFMENTSLGTIVALIAFLIGFGLIVFVHELGHFLAAKWVGVKVLQFAIGFGHAIVSYRKGFGLRLGSSQSQYDQLVAKGQDTTGISETEYRLNWMPLGGYVKMLGQEDFDPSAASGDPRSFSRKPIWARTCVITAGVVMNVIFAIVFFMACFLHGLEFPAPIIGELTRTMPAETTFAQGHDDEREYRGLQPGDRILSVDGERIEDFTGFQIRIALASRDQILNVKVERDGEELIYPLKPRQFHGEGLLAVGVGHPRTLQLLGILEQWQAAGAQPGMTLTSVDGQSVARYSQLKNHFSESKGHAVEVEFTGDQTDEIAQVAIEPEIALQLKLVSRDSDSYIQHLFGFTPVTRINKIQEGSLAAEAGIQPGDLITSLAGTVWPRIEQIKLLIDTCRKEEKAFTVTLHRNGQSTTTPSIMLTGKKLLGIGYEPAVDLPMISQCIDDEPAEKLALPAGSQILSVNNQPVADFRQLLPILKSITQASPEGGHLAIGYQLAIKDRPIYSSQLEYGVQHAKDLRMASWQVPGELHDALKPHDVFIKAGTMYEAVTIGIKKTQEFVLRTYITLKRLAVDRTVSLTELRGPVGIIHIGTIATERGWPYWAFVLGLISVNLAVINFLPIPITDGGHIIFLIIEKIKGSPVSAKVQTAAFFVGLVLIASVFLFTLFNDTTRLIGLG